MEKVLDFIGLKEAIYGQVILTELLNAAGADMLKECLLVQLLIFPMFLLNALAMITMVEFSIGRL